MRRFKRICAKRILWRAHPCPVMLAAALRIIGAVGGGETYYITCTPTACSGHLCHMDRSYAYTSVALRRSHIRLCGGFRGWTGAWCRRILRYSTYPRQISLVRRLICDVLRVCSCAGFCLPMLVLRLVGGMPMPGQLKSLFVGFAVRDLLAAAGLTLFCRSCRRPSLLCISPRPRLETDGKKPSHHAGTAAHDVALFFGVISWCQLCCGNAGAAGILYCLYSPAHATYTAAFSYPLRLPAT
jgi:hypothetical protein